MAARPSSRPRSNSIAPVSGQDGELRRVSILFADILNSTAMVQHLDPEGVAELLDPPLDAMRAAVNRHDGVVSHLGDGILAVFGAPSACEDHAVRACLAALSIQDSLAELAPVRARVGIHTGDVVMRERRIGRAQIWEPVGPALTVAARIEQSAEPGTVRISAATADGARGFVATTPLPALIAKGFDEPLTIERLTAAEPGVNRWTVRSASGLVDMVDRSAEQRALRAFLGGANGPGLHVLQLYGDAGVGKSRLLHEALQAVDAAEVFVARLHGDPHRQDSAFHAFGLWLRGWLDIRAGDPPETARQLLADRLRRVADLTQPGRSSLARLLGLRPSSAGAPPEMEIVATAMLAVLRQAASQRRLVLACEDIDCFDAASRDLLAAIAGPGETEAAQRNLLIVTTSRPRVRLPGPGTAQAIHLMPLSPADTLELLFHIDGRFAQRPDLAVVLQEKTGGNPLFVEEVAATTLPILDRTDRVPRSRTTDPDELPDRVEQLIADRLSRLPRALRRLVQLCAVVGDAVPLRLLARLAEMEEAALHKQLLRLGGEHILTETRRYPDPEFAFRNGLTREAAYRGILHGRRRALHDQVRELLENDDTGMSANRLDDLCFHSVRAQNWPRALAHLRAAVALAVDKSAYQVARLRMDQGLDAARRLPDSPERLRERLRMLEEMPLLLRAEGRYAEVGTGLDEAEDLARQLGDRAAVARVAAQRIHLLSIAGRMEEAVALGQAACAEVEADGDEALVVLVSHNLAQAFYNQGQVRVSADMLGRLPALLAPGIGVSRPGSIGSLNVLVHVTWALSLAFAGEESAAEAAAEAARAGAEETGRPYDKAYAALAAGIARTRSRPAEAADKLLDGLAICEAGQIEQALPALLAALAHALIRCGDYAGAADAADRGYGAARRQARPMIMCFAASALGHARWRLGAREEGMRVAAEAVALGRRDGFRAFLTLALRQQAAVLEPAGSVSALREAEALAVELGLDGELMDCRAALATLTPGR